MNNLFILDLLIFIFLLYSKIYSFYYCITYEKTLKQYKNLKYFIILKPNISYTHFSLNLLYIWFFIKYYFNYNISQINYSIWCMNFIVSISYWFLKIYIINNNKPKSNTFLYKLSDILCHGGISFLTTFTLLDNKINYFNLIYTITLSIFWFLCILTPWCYFTNDNIHIFK